MVRHLYNSYAWWMSSSIRVSCSWKSNLRRAGNRGLIVGKLPLCLPKLSFNGCQSHGAISMMCEIVWILFACTVCMGILALEIWRYSKIVVCGNVQQVTSCIVLLFILFCVLAFFYLCLFVCLCPVYLSICLCLAVILSVCLPTYLSICLCLPAYLSLCVYVSACFFLSFPFLFLFFFEREIYARLTPSTWSREDYNVRMKTFLWFWDRLGWLWEGVVEERWWEVVVGREGGRWGSFG